MRRESVVPTKTWAIFRAEIEFRWREHCTHPENKKSSSASIHTLCALAPLRLAPVSSATEVSSSATEVAARAAKSSSALLVDNGSAVLASLGNTSTGSWLRGLGLGVALSVALLATGSAVESLVLDVVLGAAVSGRRAAAVEVAVGTNTRAGHTSLSTTADIDLGDLGRERGGWLAGGHQGGGSSSLAGGSGTGEGLEAGRVTVGSTSVTPSILGAAFAGSADLVSDAGPQFWAKAADASATTAMITERILMIGGSIRRD